MNFSSPYLDTIISMVLVYSILSILVSVILEWWNQFMKARGVVLQQTIFKLLNDPLNQNYGYLIYQHPTINKMRKDGNSYPHYISAETFCNALIDTIAELPYKFSYELENGVYKKKSLKNEKNLAERFQAGVDAMKDSEMKLLFANFIDRNIEAGQLNLKALKTEMGTWYDDYMDRVSGQFKSINRPKLLRIGFLVAFILNIDSLHLMKVFFMDNELRTSMVQQAEVAAKAYEESEGQVENARYALVQRALLDMQAADTGRNAEDSSARDSLHRKKINMLLADQEFILSKLDSAQKGKADSVFMILSRWQIPLGYDSLEAPYSWIRQWKGIPAQKSLVSTNNTPQQNSILRYFEARNKWSFWGFIKWLIGISITGLSLGYGAPFWFQTLVKLVNIRSAGVKPAKMVAQKALGKDEK